MILTSLTQLYEVIAEGLDPDVWIPKEAIYKAHLA